MKKVLLIFTVLSLMLSSVGCTENMDSNMSSSVISGEDVFETVPETDTLSSTSSAAQNISDKIINMADENLYSDKFITSYINYTQ
ncbi:hypothetical protein [Porcipelethomonas sp.]|uniref:hypothetical protein n=1 Tax=Porcipelethomonas sp. TaxID=2981675 RepID=UPI003EFA360A